MKETKHKILTSLKEVSWLIKACKTTGYCSFDFETAGIGVQYEDDYPTIVAISFQPGSAFVIPLGHFDSPFKHNFPKILRKLSRELFENPKVVKVAQNAKFEHKWLLRYWCNMRGRIFDTMLAKYLLDEERPHGLKEITTMMFPDLGGYELENRALVKKHGWAGVPLAPLSKYCAIDADMTLRIMIKLEPKLIKHNFYQLFRNMLMMAHRVLLESESRGMLIDTPYLKGLSGTYQLKLGGIDKELRDNKVLFRYERFAKKDHVKNLIESTNLELEELYEELDQAKEGGDSRKINSANRKIKSREEKVSRYIAGDLKTKKERWENFNFSSPKQLIGLLYTHRKGFKQEILDYTDTKDPSTAEETLKKILFTAKQEKKKPLVKLITNLLEYRSTEKLYSTYIKGMLEKVTANDHIHGNFLIHGTVTGRLSSRDPNLQNIPRGTTASDIKKMFIPPKGYLFLEVDYSQAELRVVGEVSRDKEMISIFKRGYNVHLATGLKMEGLFDDENYKVANSARKDPDHPDNVYWTKLHKRGKSTNFSILYGQSDYQLAEALGCTKGEASNFKKEWFSQFPGVTRWIKKQNKHAEEHGFVYSLWGRKRRLPDATRKNEPGAYGYYAKAMRDAINAPIQGASNDFTLFASILIREMKLRGELPWDLHQAYTVHDSLGYWIQPKDAHWVIPKLIEVCKNPETKKWFNFQPKHIEMKVSPEMGLNWGGIQAYKEDTDYEEWLKSPQYVHNQYN